MLATNPFLTGSPPRQKTLGMVVVAVFDCERGGGGAQSCNDIYPPANKVGRQRRKQAEISAGPPVVKQHIAAFDKATFV
jgi:hypothetical protein